MSSSLAPAGTKAGSPVGAGKVAGSAAYTTVDIATNVPRTAAPRLNEPRLNTFRVSMHLLQEILECLPPDCDVCVTDGAATYVLSPDAKPADRRRRLPGKISTGNI